MKEILDAEKIKYEEGALSIISKSADGSMRDALSLLDQALAYEDYELSENNVIDMLGLIDNKYALSIIQSILNQIQNCSKSSSTDWIQNIQITMRRTR